MTPGDHGQATDANLSKIEHRELFDAMIREADENERAMLRTRYIAAIQADARREVDAIRKQSRGAAAIREAAKEISAAWDAWMEHEEGEGMDRMENAIAALRAALGGGR